MLDQRAQRVAVRGDQHGLAGAQVGHDDVRPSTGMKPVDHVLEALGARARRRDVGVARVGVLAELAVVGSSGGGGVS